IVGTRATIEDGTPNEETVIVTGTTATTFSAVFSKNHGAGAPIVLNRSVVARIAQDGSAVQISQDLTPNGDVSFVAVHPSDPNVLSCVTTDQRVWSTNAAPGAGPGTMWAEISPTLPTAGAI